MLVFIELPYPPKDNYNDKYKQIQAHLKTLNLIVCYVFYNNSYPKWCYKSNHVTEELKYSTNKEVPPIALKITFPQRRIFIRSLETKYMFNNYLNTIRIFLSSDYALIPN